VKLIRSGKEQFTFSLYKREKLLLFHILQMYPLVPVTHHRLSKGEKGGAQDEDQHVLEEALTESRRENRQRVLALLAERFHQTAKEFEFTVAVPEIQWLLQVLNDLRVGAWIALGQPDELQVSEINETNAPYILAMEAAGQFQFQLLTHLGYTQPPLEPGEA
jgi:hypothetical protein